MIELKDVSKTLSHREILRHVSLEIKDGESLGLNGPNGSGKTIILKTILGFVRPSSGEVLVNGVPNRAKTLFATAIGFSLGEEALLPNFSATKNLELIVLTTDHELNRQVIREALIRVELNPDDRRPIKFFSLGMKQRVSLAAALINNEPTMIFDEPTNGIDKKGQLFLRELFSELWGQHKTLIITSHDETFLNDVTDRILEVSAGEVTASEE
ncbi:ABC transporter ATP-binding protein [Lapidilactobacillus concavus DSM 17758]|uniref:ABC transporter ATP-binding protein n=1 Tax=Lapidilactobacillus concavus DSM 17758 TaxID=1423735 RepID=A0A0R1W2P4_9LACO|nr:ATP-binding cassette domain-containing protein [Lapidilactobacillus concavus]KRM10395.1 ABC transporter ATP-binding protein [Lapidilactobacillus concavus DSM 17758]GEL13387.1 hypothetical protein LCO01nite_09360 [Lapidilactobacillus concavus]